MSELGEVRTLTVQAATDNLKSRVLGGFAWNAVSSITNQVLQIVFGVVLARLLTPHDYGLAAMVLVFSSLVLILSDLSLGAGLVQRRTITELDRSTVFWTSCAVGVCLTLAGIAVAGPVAGFYGEPRVKGLFIVASMGFFLVSLQTTQHAILQREMKFRIMNLRLVAANLVGGAVGVALAAKGFGPWALIAQQLSLGLVSTILLWWASPWRPQRMYSFASLRDLGSFGGNMLGARLVGYVHRNADNLLVGRFLGASALGAYSIAYNMMLIPLTRLNIPLQDTLFPAMSQLQDDRERLARMWLRVNRVLATLVVPAMSGVVVVAPDLVDVVLGRRWHRAVPVLQILAPVGLVQSLSGFGVRIFAALGNARALFVFSVISASAALPAFAIGLRWGIVGVAGAYAAVNIPLQLFFLGRAVRAVEISVARYARNLRGVLEATAVMVLGTLGTRLVLVGTGIPSALTLLLTVAVGAGLYVLASVWRSREVLADLRSLRKDKSQPAATAVPS